MFYKKTSIIIYVISIVLLFIIDKEIAIIRRNDILLDKKEKAWYNAIVIFLSEERKICKYFKK